MRFVLRDGGFLLALFASVCLLASGCGQTGDKGGKAQKGNPSREKRLQVAEKTKGHDHSGWWCEEHGVPEEACGQCSAKVAVESKKKGDWCKEHDRPDSQCFLCHPELKERFAAQYRAKYGKEPPPTEDDTSKKDETPKKG
jgi:cobalt-zinc-cadmium efflux system membrane fusion protein